MLDKLADWYRSVGIEPEDAQIKARWPGVEAWCKSATIDQALDTVRLYRRIPTVTVDFRSTFNEPFIESDTTFRTKGNDNELVALAAACIANFIASNQVEQADITALATTCSRIAIASTSCTIEEIESRCDLHLSNRAVHARDFAPSALKLQAETLSAIKKLSESLTGSDVKVVSEALTPILNDFANFVAETSRSVGRSDQLYRESSDVIWWLFGGRSTSLKCPFESLPIAGLPFILGAELAARTRITPGFHAASQFLAAATGYHRTEPPPAMSIISAVTDLTSSVLDLFGVDSEPPHLKGLAPCIAAVAHRCLHPEKTIWTKLFDEQYPQLANQNYSPEILARQVYDELMLRNALPLWDA